MYSAAKVPEPDMLKAQAMIRETGKTESCQKSGFVESRVGGGVCVCMWERVLTTGLDIAVTYNTGYLGIFLGGGDLGPSNETPIII